MNKYQEEDYIKSENIFCKLIISRWSVGFTKPIISCEILADSPRRRITHKPKKADKIVIWQGLHVYIYTFRYNLFLVPTQQCLRLKCEVKNLF